MDDVRIALLGDKAAQERLTAHRQYRGRRRCAGGAWAMGNALGQARYFDMQHLRSRFRCLEA